MDQEFVDKVVERCEALVEIHGGQSDILIDIRRYYDMFSKCIEPMSYILLDEALREIEQ